MKPHSYSRSRYLILLFALSLSSAFAQEETATPEATYEWKRPNAEWRNAKEQYNPIPRKEQTPFQKRFRYRGFRLEVYPLSSRFPEKDGYVIVDFKRERRLVITPERVAKGIPALDYFEVNYHENRYEFGIRGREFRVPISNRIAPFLKKRRGHQGLRAREDVEPGTEAYSEKQQTIADKMTLIRQHNAQQTTE